MACWYGNPDRFGGLGDFIRHQILISYPFAHDEPNRFQLYIHAMKTAVLNRQGDRRPLLVIDNCRRTMGHLAALPQGAEFQNGEDLYPAVYTLGAAYMSIRQYRPWMSAGRPRAYNIDDGFGF